MATQRDYYEILGLKKGASKADIKSAYRKMALQYHPDRNKEKDAEEKFKEINEAYQVLSDDKKRQAYDQFGHVAFSQAGGMGSDPFGGGFRQGPFTWTYTTSNGGNGGNPFAGFNNEDFGDPFDIFEQFFGGGFARAARRPRYSLRVDFMEAVNGVTKTVTIDGKKQTVKIPAGANDGTRIRFQNFDITVDVAPHTQFKREGYDVFIDQKISFVTASLGGTIEVPTLKKPLKMKVRSGTQSHTLVRLRGEGVKHLNHNGYGDLYVRLIVEVPEKLTAQQKEQIKQLGL